jgi:PleD family two-component response regulator
MAKQNKILIVEDDPDTAEMLRAYFSEQGYQVLSAAWGNDAIKLCQDVVPDLIIQDIRLPDMDGYQVVRELHKNLRTSRVPIIFLTEKRGRNDRISGLKLGAVDYITKPFDMQELRLRVQNVLRRASYTSLVSPVTSLPGKKVVMERLEDLLGESQWAAIYISLKDIDSFSEVYGFVAGDDVLRAVGLIINSVMDESGGMGDFVGHVDKATFLLITREDSVQDVLDKLTERLSRAFDYFYPIKDVESGRIAAPMQAEVGVVAASTGPYESPADVIRAARMACQVVAASSTAKRE